MADSIENMMLDGSMLDSDEEDNQDQRVVAPATPAPASAPGPRVIRRRARRACIKCHERKVRCDVVRQGQPCTNCRLDAHQCIVRMRGDPEPRAHVARADTLKPHLMPASELPIDEGASPLAAQLDTGSSSSNETFLNCNARTPLSSLRAPQIPPAQGLPFGAYQSNGASQNLDVIFSYYHFVEPEPLSHIAADDFKYLEYKGCLHLPVRSILDNFICEYFLHVHPCLPILNERDFWNTYLDEGGRSHQRKPIPLFVLRCMIFASCSFLPLPTIRAMGFESFREARTCFYHRAKLLFDFGTTSNPISIAQGALLLTYFSSERQQHANTSWLRISIQFAMSANAHLYHQSTIITEYERQTHKRLWWCCIIRDRVLPLGVRRSIQITYENFDFSQPMLCEEDLEVEFDHSRVYDRDTKRCLARVFQTQLELAVALTGVIALVYPAKHFSFFDQVDSGSLEDMPAKIQRCRDDLDKWNNREKDSPWTSRHESITLYHDLTQIYYHSARAALYHHEACLLQATSTGPQGVILQRLKEIGTELYSAIASISENVGEVVQQGIARYLPVSAVAYMALPLILISIDCQAGSSVGSVSNSKRRQLRVYNEAFDLCHSRYTGVVQASAFISKTISTACLVSSKNSIGNVPHNDAISRVGHQPVGTNWLDAFISHPKLYLRIALTIDMSLALGRYLEAEELPKRLQMLDAVATQISIPRMPTPVIDFRNEGSQVMLIGPAREVKESRQHVNLDYFELSGRRSPTRTDDGGMGMGLWNGSTLDEMLEDILSGRAYAESL